MTLQQLRYLIAISEDGSINAAAQRLYTSQSTLSMAVKDLENELGVTIFTRSNRGVTLTNDGAELLGYARQVIEQADMMEGRYARGHSDHKQLAVSTQHYYFSLQAFINIAERCASERYDFTLRECSTGQIIEDVRTFRSDIGILYLDSFNSRVLGKVLSDSELVFHPLFNAKVHVFVGAHHPLAGRASVGVKDLVPYPRYSFEQGTTNSFYYAEEPLGYLACDRNIRVTDRGSLTNLLTSFNGYTVSTGVLSSEMHEGIVAIPLEVDELMQVGYVLHQQRRPGSLLTGYIDELQKVIAENPTVDPQ